MQAFTAAHRTAHADRPEGPWFDDLAGGCEGGSGVAWCHREQVTYEGPFAAGLPDGEGHHLYPGDKAMVGVQYEAGRLHTIGHKQVPPVPAVASVGQARDAWFASGYTDLSHGSLEGGW